ncbi:Integrase [Theobroma cacao]|nr:Integrase [Theobroma cacao]
MGNVADIMLHLHEMFSRKTRSTKVKAINAFMDLKQKPGELFKLDYELHTRDYTLSGLMDDLQNVEEVLDLKKKPEAHGLVGAKKKPMKKKIASKDNTKGKCFHCGVKGHWKQNCKVYLEEIQKSQQGIGFLNMLKACLVVDSTDAQIVDFGATNHGFQHRRKLSKGQFRMRMENDTFVLALAVGAITLQFPYGRYINQNRLNRLIKDGTLPDMVEGPLPVCESCIEAKMTKGLFKAKDLVHINVCGPMNIKARGGYEYFITFIDDYSRHSSVYLIHKKSESLEKFKEFKAEVEKQLRKPWKQLRSDRGSEYLSDEFQQYLTDNGIVSNLSATRTP